MHQGPPALWPEPSPQESLQGTGSWPGVHCGAELRPHATLADSRSTEPWTHRLCHLPPVRLTGSLSPRLSLPSRAHSKREPPKCHLQGGQTDRSISDSRALQRPPRAPRGRPGTRQPLAPWHAPYGEQAAARSRTGGRQRGRVAARSQAGRGPTIPPVCRLSHAPSPHTHPTLCLLRHHRTSRSNRMLGVPDDTRAPHTGTQVAEGKGRYEPPHARVTCPLSTDQARRG